MAMIFNVARHTTLIGLSALVALPVYAQHDANRSPTTSAFEVAVLERPAVFEVISVSGSLKETKQTGQELTWRGIERPAEGSLRISNLSVGLLSVRGQVTMTFSGSSSSLGYMTSNEAQLHIIFRSKGGAALHTSVVGFWVKCTDKDQTLHPPTSEIPNNIAGVVFANVGLIEITEHAEPSERGLKVRRCS
jgi:hypothetical protein